MCAVCVFTQKHLQNDTKMHVDIRSNIFMTLCAWMMLFFLLCTVFVTLISPYAMQMLVSNIVILCPVAFILGWWCRRREEASLDALVKHFARGPRAPGDRQLIDC